MCDPSGALDREKPDTGRITGVSRNRDNRQLPRQDENSFRNKKPDEKMKRIEEMPISLKNKEITINAKVKEAKFLVKEKANGGAASS